MSLADQFRARLPHFLQRVASQHRDMAVCAGVYNEQALSAARNLLGQPLSADDVAAAGALGDPACLLCCVSVPLPAAAAQVRVPMDAVDAAVEALGQTACIRLDNVGVSLLDVARIMMSPANAQLVEDLARRDLGLTMAWRTSMLGCVDDFRQDIANMMAGQTQEVCVAMSANMTGIMQRYALWLARLPLPAPIDVVQTWGGAHQAERLTPEQARELVLAASDADWDYCVHQLHEWMEQQTAAAVNAIIRSATAVNGGASLMAALAHVQTAMQTLTARYLRMRYLAAGHLRAAVHAAHNYLSCTVRVAYTGMTPANGIGRRGATDAAYVFGADIGRSARAPALCDDKHITFVGRLLQRTAHSGVVAAALTAAANGRTMLTLENAAVALFVAFAWRWFYIGHIVPKMLPRLQLSDRMCASLALFARADTPSAFVAAGEPPRLAEIVRSYLACAWHSHVNTTDRCLTLLLQLPYGGEPTLPPSVVGRHTLQLAAAAAPDSDSDSDDDAADADRLSRRFNRRQHTLLDARPLAKLCKKQRSPLPPTEWGRAALRATLKIPRNRNIVTPADPLDAATPALPPVPFDVCIPANMPARCFAPQPPVPVGCTRPLIDYMERMTDMHTEHVEAGRAPDGVFVRPRQLVALIAYWLNQCQSAVPGIVLGTRTRTALAAHIARHVGATKSRKRSMRIRKQSPLFPLGQRMVALAKLDKNRTNTTDMVLDNAPTMPVLHTLSPPP